MKYPFWGQLACRLNLVPAIWLPTTAVDAYGHLYYNPWWVAEDFAETGKPMTLQDSMFEFAHEVMHLMFRHHARRPAGAIPAVWNLACDQVGDTHIVESGLKPSTITEKMVPQEVRDACKQADGKIKPSEQRYHELEKRMKDCPACRKVLAEFKKQVGDKHDKEQKAKEQEEQQGQDEPSEEQSQGDQEGHEHGEYCGNGGDHQHDESKPKGDEDGMWGEGTGDYGVHICGNVRQCCSPSMQEADAQTVEEWKQHFMAAAKLAKSRGKCPGFAEDFLTELERPKRDWRDVVRTQASTVFRGRYTQKRPARRSHATGVRLPARQPKPKPAAVAFDASGSVSAMASRFASEIVGILEAAGAEEIWVLFHDVKVYHMDLYTKESLKTIKVTHGGTSHIDVFQKLEEIKPKPGMLICLTDLYSDQMSLQDPGIPIIWATPEGVGDEMPVPFGKRVSIPCDLKEEK